MDHSYYDWKKVTAISHSAFGNLNSNPILADPSFSFSFSAKDKTEKYVTVVEKLNQRHEL